MSRPKTLDLDLIIRPEQLATAIQDRYISWKNARAKKESEWKELRSYVFAVDTVTTPNAKLPWKNKTHRPKLCQIRDNLYANYMAALFPSDRWFRWEAGDTQALSKEKAKAIEAYMSHIFKNSGFEEIVDKWILDYVDYGNCFGDVDYVEETTPEGLQIYVGPKPIRISPLDIVFDITGPSFAEVPKITRTSLTFGQLEKLRKSFPQWKSVSNDIIAKMKDVRATVRNSGAASIRKADMDKAAALTADGFGSLYEYYCSNSIEILEFEGDIFDADKGVLLENHVVTVIDRAYVVRKEPAKNWFGKSVKQHCGWRTRPDNLMAMGPLDNLVGMQYRIDHLENLKADVFDLIAYPVIHVAGYAEDFVYGPNERIYTEQDTSVEFIRPDTTALNADLQIRELEDAMETMAGAPRQAMGIRTPGEKTAFEVQELANAASRIFQMKIRYFEKWFLEPLINAMLESARRNLNTEVLVKVVADDLGVQDFIKITRDDLMAKGRLVAMGARHFAAQSQLVQNLNALSSSGLYQDPEIRNHLSGKKLAELIEDNLNLSRYDLFVPNIRIMEAMETAQIQQQAQEELQMSAMTPTEDQPTEVVDTQGPMNEGTVSN